MQEWVHCTFRFEVHLSVRLPARGWYTDKTVNLFRLQTAWQKCRASGTTWEYFIVEVAGGEKKATIEQSRFTGEGGEKVLLRVNRPWRWGIWGCSLRVWSSLNHPWYSYTTGFLFKEESQHIQKCIFSMYLHKLKKKKKPSLLSQWWLGC